MKLLTCVVPCYNSAAYMERAVDSLLAGGEASEVIIVNDGSTDETDRRPAGRGASDGNPGPPPGERRSRIRHQLWDRECTGNLFQGSRFR